VKTPPGVPRFAPTAPPLRREPTAVGKVYER
jgi:hypothetical protein